MLEIIVHNKKNRLGRMIVCGACSQAVAAINTTAKAFGSVGDELESSIRHIKVDLEQQKKISAGKVSYYFEFELLRNERKVEVWHTKINGERDELMCEIKQI